MAESNSIVNLGDLSKPATVLIEKISNAVGVLYEPRRIVKKAEAKAKAEKIKALASIELGEIEQRAINRFVQQEARKQENIESITMQAASQLPPGSDPSNIDEDWIANLFDKCETVSDKEMQSLWSRLLSCEAVNPGAFSKRTVEFVSVLDKKDALLFTNFCQFLWQIGDLVPFIFNTNDEIFVKNGVNFSVLKHLDDIGLISFNIATDYLRKGNGQTWLLKYYGRPIFIDFGKKENNQLINGKVLLTKTGQELARIAGGSMNEEYFEYVIRKLFEKEIVTYSFIPNKAN